MAIGRTIALALTICISAVGVVAVEKRGIAAQSDFSSVGSSAPDRALGAQVAMTELRAISSALPSLSPQEEAYAKNERQAAFTAASGQRLNALYNSREYNIWQARERVNQALNDLTVLENKRYADKKREVLSWTFFVQAVGGDFDYHFRKLVELGVISRASIQSESGTDRVAFVRGMGSDAVSHIIIPFLMDELPE